MAFDLATAKVQPKSSGGFDLSTAKIKTKEPEPTFENVGVVGTVFTDPLAASSREAIRSNPKLAVFGPLAGVFSNLGAFGKETQKAADKGFAQPSKSETFQNEILRTSTEDFVNEASKRTGMFSPQTKLGKSLIEAESFIRGYVPSAVGLIADEVVNPSSVILSAIDIGRGTAKPIFTNSEKLIKKAVSKYRKAASVGVRGQSTKSDIVKKDSNISKAMQAINDNADEIIYEDGARKGLPQNINDSVEAASQTKEKIFKEYNRLRSLAEEKGDVVNLDGIALKALKEQSTRAAKTVNPQLQRQAFKYGINFSRQWKVGLGEADEILKGLNQELKSAYRSKRAGNLSIADESMAQVKARFASELRKAINEKVLKVEGGDKYQELRSTYGALVQMEEEMVKKATKLASQNGSSFEAFSQSFDSVPIIYGVFTGNVPLATAGVLQRASKQLIKRSSDANHLIKNAFVNIKRTNQAKKISPVGLTAIAANKAINSTEGY